MNILLILAHPDPESLNHAFAEISRSVLADNGHIVNYHDLYNEHFDPILPGYEIPRNAPLDPSITLHCRHLTDADGIIIIHPNWWGQPPAILKGWIDRVIRPGVAYQFIEGDKGEGIPEGLLKIKSAIIINTSNTPAERENTVFGDPLERIWRDCIFGLCRIPDIQRLIFRVVVTSDPETRKSWLREIKDVINTTFPKFPA